MKEFIVGLLVGAAAFGIGDRLIDTHGSAPESRPLSLTNSHRAQQPSVVAPIESPASRSDPARSADASERTTAAPLDVPVATTTDRVIRRDGEPEPMDVKCHEWFQYKSQREEAALTAEPKDPQWSYSTEQLLQQFVVGHRQAFKYQLTSVDCRTTYCEIKGTGTSDQKSADVFQQVLQEAAAERWSDFTPYMASSSTTHGDKQTFEYRMRRKQ